MLLSDFDYDLPEERIAQVPIEPRNASRLMVLDPVTKEIEHRHFYDLKEFLEPGDTLIFNDTRVMPARLIGHRDQTGGKVEVYGADAMMDAAIDYDGTFTLSGGTLFGAGMDGYLNEQ